MMMAALVRYALALYFAAVLGVAGLAKLERPALFALLLRRQGLLPAWCIGAVSRILPWCELALAAALVAGVAPMPVAAVTLALFVTFLAAQALLALLQRGAPCGCYSAAAIENTVPASVATAMLLVGLAAAYLWSVGHVPAIDWHWRTVGVVLFTGCTGWIGGRIRQRRTRHLVCGVG